MLTQKMFLIIFRCYRGADKSLARPWKETSYSAVAYSGILFEGGASTNSVEDKGQGERGSGGGCPLVRGSGGSCNLVQEIPFHIITFS